LGRFDEFLAGYEPGELEEVRKVQVIDNEFPALMKKYEKTLDDERSGFINHSDFSRINQNITEVLRPAEINSFLHSTRIYEDHQRYSWKTALVLSSLIQNSYNKGYNHFMLTNPDHPNLPFMGAYIIGQEKNPLYLTLQGDVGVRCGERARYCVLNFNGDVDRFCGFLATDSTFIFKGEAGKKSGTSTNRCTFKTPIWDDIKEMKKHVPKEQGNILILLLNGEEVRAR